jgi:hypothetical protein
MAVLVLDNATLEVRAYAGSADFSDDARFSHVDMVQAGGPSRNPRKFRHPKSNPARSASGSIILPPLWNV